MRAPGAILTASGRSEGVTKPSRTPEPGQEDGAARRSRHRAAANLSDGLETRHPDRARAATRRRAGRRDRDGGQLGKSVGQDETEKCQTPPRLKTWPLTCSMLVAFSHGLQRVTPVIPSKPRPPGQSGIIVHRQVNSAFVSGGSTRTRSARNYFNCSGYRARSRRRVTHQVVADAGDRDGAITARLPNGSVERQR